ncbi:MAG: hypothetical protein H6619_02260 [Deltaproteobacteria bacterium]|nr:hypothetical protein [Deltaproteobacteria bacterium]
MHEPSKHPVLNADPFPGHPDFNGPLTLETQSYERIELAGDPPYQDSLRYGIEVADGSGETVILKVKGVELFVDPGTEYEELHGQFKDCEFNVLSRNYERDFLQANAEFYACVAGRIHQVTACCPRLDVLSIAAGQGYELDTVFARGREGKFLGLDPSEQMLRVLEGKDDRYPETAIHTRVARAHALLEEHVREDIIDTIGRPTLVTCVAGLHVIDKTGRSEGDALGKQVRPILAAVVDMMQSGGFIVVGNYYHKTDADYERFAQIWHDKQVANGVANPHQPTPPNKLFTPQQMGRMLEGLGLNVDRMSPNDDVMCSTGIRGYVMVARKL